MYISLIENNRSSLIHLHSFQLFVLHSFQLFVQKSQLLNRLGCRNFWRIANSVLNEGKSHIPPLFSGLEVLSSAADKAKLFDENFSKNSNLDDSGISLPVFPSRTNLKLHNISLTPKMVKMVVMNLDLSKASGSDFIPVVVLKTCEPELSYILAELINKCLKESCFPDCWQFPSVVPVFKNVGERCTAKIYRPVNHPEKCGLFLISSMVLGLLDQLQILSQLFLIEFLGLLIGLGLLKLWHLIIQGF